MGTWCIRSPRDNSDPELVKCSTCGAACTGHSSNSKGKRYHYYSCLASRSNAGQPKVAVESPHRPPYLNALWLEGLVWADVRGFLKNPGEVLGRVREQFEDEDDGGEAEARREDLAARLASRSAEKDRYVRAYAQGHISEEELEVHLVDLKNQTDNLRLLFASEEARLSQKRKRA